MAKLEPTAAELRDTGIGIIGYAPWGTHFCHFYETKEDLADLLVPYFKAGLENNEFCMWVTSDPLGVADAKRALRQVLPQLDHYIEKQQIEILDYSEWYTKGGKFDADRVLESWVEKARSAVERGFDGLRLTGNTFWLEERDWNSFADYEATVNNVIGQHPMIALCSYALQKCGPHEFMDVVHNHQFALVKRQGKWELLASPALRLARQALLEERTRGEERVTGILESLTDGFVSIDREWRYTFVNAAAERILGRRREELLGRDMRVEFPDPDAARIYRHYERAMAQQEPISLEEYYPPLGVWVEMRAHPWADGLSIFFRDITERKRAEDTLRHHAALLTGLSDGVIATDKQWLITAWNPAAEALFGWKAGEVLGQPTADILTRIERDGRPFLREESRRALADTGRFRAELTYYRRNGTPVEVESSAVAIHDGQGQPAGYVTVLRDITERKQAEEALQNLATFPSENPNPIIRVANDGTVMFANESSRPLLELWRCEAGASLPPEQLQQVQEALAAGKLVTAESMCGDRTFLVIHAPITGRDYVNIYGVDITELKRAEGELAEQQRLLKSERDLLDTIMQNTEAQLAYLDPQFNFVRVNCTYAKGSGHADEELIGRNHFDLFPSEENQAIFEKVRDTGEPVEFRAKPFEFADQPERGVTYWDWTLIPIKDISGQVQGLVLSLMDVTERIQTEQAALRAKEEWERTFDAVPDLVAILDERYHIVRANRAMAQRLGATPDECINKICYEVVHGLDRPPAFCPHTPSLVDGREHAAEVHEPRLGGEFIVTTTPLLDEQGKRLGSVHVARDITERKRAEEALRENEERLLQTRDYLEKLIDYANAPIIVWDPSFTITRFNGAFERLTGRPASEVVGERLDVLFPEQERAASMEKIDRTVRGEFWELMEIPILHQSGQVRQVLWNSANITGADGRTVVATIAQGTDITERKRAEEVVRQHREDLAHAQAVAHTGSWRLDVRRDELTWSDETYRMFGIPKGTPMTYEMFLAAVHPEDREYVDQEWAAALRGELYDIEHRIIVDDNVRWVRERAELEFDKDGALLGGFGTAQDITELKQAEEALERLRTEFMGMVTHELKTPLTAIKGSAATALGSQRPLAVEESHELFEIIDEQADRLRELMDNLLDATRIEAGTLSVSPEPTDLREVIEDARATFARSGGRHQILVEVPADMPRVHADRRRLFQVLMNLLNNAGMFSAPTEPITIAAELNSLQVTVHVRDRGRGIPKEKLPLLFRKFSRLHDDAGQKLSGTGLGLAICKGIVEAHGGRIWADSAGECEGSTFSFTLPVASEVSVKALSDEARRAVHLGRVRRPTEKTRVLAVDDEPQILRFLRRSLDEAGYQPIVTADPCEVAKLVELEEPDLVLLDLMLPGTSGFELLERIREFSGVPVIFLTGSDREEDAVRALKEGADDYITKPFSPSELLARIGAALRRRVLPDVMEARPAFLLNDLVIDFAERRVTVAGQEVSLSATEYKILHQLATNAGRPLSYEQLLHQVWGPEYSAETELVRSFIRNLRRKLGDDAQHPRFILTERQVGYRMPKP